MISIIHLVAFTLFLAQPTTSSQPAATPTDTREREGNRLHATPNDVHGLIRDDLTQTHFGNVIIDGQRAPQAGDWSISHTLTTKGCFGSETFTSREIGTPFPFNDVVPSWNVNTGQEGSARFELRLGRKNNEFWTPWYYLGCWGKPPVDSTKVLDDENGTINIDYFQSHHAFDRMQYRITVFGHASTEPAIRSVALAYSNTMNDAELAKKFRKEVDPGPKEKWARRLPVPYRSQRWESEKLRGQICSPTSTSMVLEYRGVKKPTVEVCQRIFDPEYVMYGNWWRAVQGAYSFGVPGYIERFGDWNAVKKHIAQGQPVIASIKVKRGELRDAPYRQTAGHLIVITGFSENDDVCVNDPAAADAKEGQTTHAREDMEKVWLANGGVGYILEPPGRKLEGQAVAP